MKERQTKQWTWRHVYSIDEEWLFIKPYDYRLRPEMALRRSYTCDVLVLFVATSIFQLRMQPVSGTVRFASYLFIAFLLFLFIVDLCEEKVAVGSAPSLWNSEGVDPTTLLRVCMQNFSCGVEGLLQL